MSILKISFEQIKTNNEQQNSGFVDLGLGDAFDETVIKNRSCHPRPTEPREVPQSIKKKKQKKTEKKNPIYIFSSKSIFSPRYVFISKIQERKKMTDPYKIT